jgi:hypothetical protein
MLMLLKIVGVIVAAGCVLSHSLAIAGAPVSLASEDFLSHGSLTYKGFHNYAGPTPSGGIFEITTPFQATLYGAPNDKAVWSIECRDDTIDDRRRCEMEDMWSHVRLLFNNSISNPTLCVMANDFPNRSGIFRLEKGQPFTTQISGCFDLKVSHDLTTQLRPGVVVSTRRFQWPDPEPRDTRQTLGPSYPEALALLKFMLARRADHLRLRAH